ncbi:uncharacterized protein MELLADRAFT_95258 [Melampsora larici-populina 98AG31]|uniref:Uncharacterized protein n=1 Tax=Melampsora larici-populina (strain 98AG31 / pathotype 3-4-7) TaxID=747676 RepID=F4RCT3_MELLP|nr:uncharacterized protein MELLADRAFT_95258 [Melampsora larici-populina 98AG31]EGG09776.1 hypothetical protein MELLADRAFT_95258 [Melampsora larici-populina 98AG31]
MIPLEFMFSSISPKIFVSLVLDLKIVLVQANVSFNKSPQFVVLRPPELSSN